MPRTLSCKVLKIKTEAQAQIEHELLLGSDAERLVAVGIPMQARINIHSKEVVQLKLHAHSPEERILHPIHRFLVNNVTAGILDTVPVLYPLLRRTSCVEVHVGSAALHKIEVEAEGNAEILKGAVNVGGKIV